MHFQHFRALSRVHGQENGVPQGGVLCCLLFIGKMNSLGKVRPPTISYSMYVEDVQMSFKSCNMSICKRQVQLSVNKLASWVDKNGFNFNREKSACRKRGIHPNPDIELNGVTIRVKKEQIFRCSSTRQITDIHYPHETA